MGGSYPLESVAGRHMVSSLMDAVAAETVLVAQKSLHLVLAMGWLFNAISFLDHQDGANQRFDDSMTVGLNKKHGRYVGDGFGPDSNQVPPESKEDGDTDDDDKDEDDQEGDEQDGEEEGGGDDVSGDEDKNQDDDNPKDEVEANGDGGSDEEEEEDDDDDEDEDHDDEDEEEEEDEEDDEEEEESPPEPPAKKRK